MPFKIGKRERLKFGTVIALEIVDELPMMRTESLELNDVTTGNKDVSVVGAI